MLYNIIALKITEYMALAVIVQWTDAVVSACASAAVAEAASSGGGGLVVAER